MPATSPSTSDYVRFHAQHRPGAIALVEDGREIDYATFHLDIGRFTRALGELGVPRGSTVAVSCEGFYLHWLLLLACERLGWATASFLPDERDSLPRLLAHVQLVLCSRRPPQAAAVRWHGVTREWLTGVFSSPEAQDTDAAGAASLMELDEPQRMRRSSGTSSAFKMMVGTRRVEEKRVERNLSFMGFTPHSRLLVTVPFTVGSIYSRATACLRLGATCIGPRADIARDLVRHRPSHVWLFQFQMKAVLDGLPDDFRRSADLTLMMGSAPVSAMLWRRLRERLTDRILYTYNCNEAGGIASVSPEGECTARPGVEVEIVDEFGAAVPSGQIGEVKVRTLEMVEGYFSDPELTARRFRDGWFLTGDAGMMLAPGRFQLTGRIDEVLNIGGRKISPAAIEALVEQRAEFADVGVTSLVDGEGVEGVCIAVVPRNRLSPQDTAAWIRKCLPRDFGRIRVKLVGSIPRTQETGKVRRGELKKLFMRLR